MKKKLYSLLLCTFIFITVLSGCSQSGPESANEPAKDKENLVVEVIDFEGNSHDIQLNSLPAVTGQGGFRKSTGTIVGPIDFTGPKLLDVVNAAGGIQPDQALEITAADDYQLIFTFDQTNGLLLTYDQEGKPLHIGGLEAIIALDSSDPATLEAPPRIAFNGGICDGHFWIKDVAQIRITTAPEEWSLKLSGVVDQVLDRSTFESMTTCTDTPHPAQTWQTTDKEGNAVVYEGAPLWLAVSMIDDAEESHFNFNDELVEQDYTVEITARDGSKAELSSRDVARNNGIFLAYLKNGEPLGEEEGPLLLAGPNLPGENYMIKQIAEIKLVNLP